ncbi:hypothetical protein BS47DRAFT_1319660 [Hydnum rufescens UP504]|uniref:DUF3533 domain-containing protein n=1 Tax=Hydnum rufescens UP504 TaxID=1448309 RepID=A0A9P6ART0_9AGAM|nr:hypothetical protein BS47DRAFT_1319660 [Hydnum rufescens UP504]
MENTGSNSSVSTSPTIEVPAQKPPSPPLAPPPLNKYAYSFFAPEVTPKRKLFIKIMIKTIIVNVIFIWTALPLYWGSFAHQRDFSKFLHARFIDQDGSDLGTAMRAAFQANINARTNTKIGWIIDDHAKSFSDGQVRNLVIDETAWAVVIVHSGATAALITARENGDPSYNTSAAITFYYNQARNENGANNYVVPYTQALLNTALANFSSQYTAQYFSQQAGNVTAMQGVAGAPQTISDVFSYSSLNLRPYTSTTAQALTLVGDIYLNIFAYVLTMAGLLGRMTMKPFASFRQGVFYRILVPVLMYIPLALSYAMISLNTKVPFGSRYTYAGGFFLFFFYVWLTICALGLAIESAVTVLPPPFMPFFLLTVILCNISVASLPIQLQPWIYRYGFGLPVYNLGQATRTIIFNTESHLGANVGVLLAWITVLLVILPSFMWWSQRRQPAPAGPGPR